jgi:hypothetical protein
MVRPMPTQTYFMDLARRCRFLSHNTLDLRVARELRLLGDELEARAREAQVAANAAVPPIVQAYAPHWESEIACSLDRARQNAGLFAGATLRSIRATVDGQLSS